MNQKKGNSEFIQAKDRVIHKFVGGVFVTLVITILNFGVGFGSQFILTRLLQPEHFGKFAFSWLVVSFINNFAGIQSSKYLIQVKDNLENEVDTAFTIELILSLSTLSLTILLSPWVMRVVGKPEQIVFIQVLAFFVIVTPFQQLRSLLERQLDFHKANVSDICGLVTETVVSVYLAINGFGVWSLVIARFIKIVVLIVVLWYITPYRPKISLDIQIAKKIAAYSWPLTISAILIHFYWNIDYLIVNNLFGEEQLGYYWIAYQMTHYVLRFRANFSKVIYPTFGKLNSQKDLITGFSLLSKYTTVLILLPCIILLLLGSPTIIFLFGKQWEPATRPFQIFMILAAIRTIVGYANPIFLIEGKTKILFFISMANSAILPVMVYIFANSHGIVGAAAAVLITTLLTSTFMLWQLQKLISVEYTPIFFKPLAIASITLPIGWSIIKNISLGLSNEFLFQGSMVAAIYFLLIGLFIPDMRRNVLRLINIHQN